MSKPAPEKGESWEVTWNKIHEKKMPVILRNLAPTNPFNPLNLWPEAAEEAAIPEATVAKGAKAKGGSGKGGKGGKQAKPKKADVIREKLLKEQKDKQSKQDEEKLSNIKTVSLMKMKMNTPAGRVKQLYAILKDFIKKGQIVDAVDTLWEIDGLKFPETDELIEIKKKNKKYRKKIEEVLEGRDVVEFQLTEMSDRLPPLNLHHMNTFILDSWQKEVLAYIDQKQSMIVCAPTSSGKTVLSSYVSVIGGKVLFVVPSEALAWQVAAIFFSLLKGTVAIVTAGVTFTPPEYRVVVGTPAAIESALIDMGYDFDYAVFDEVHDLNGEEGDSLERVIKSLACPFLALSATIGNAQQLRQWWAEHHPSDVKLLEYRGRFINLQRMTWHDGKPKQLHPCAAITHDYLVHEGFSTGDLAFTPRDTFSLWQAFLKFYPKERISDLHPNDYFKQFTSDRIHLLQSKQYEDAMKLRLQSLAKEFPNETKKLLESFAPMVSNDEKVQIWEVVRQLCAQNLIPAICFQLDSVRCHQLFNELLQSIEDEEKAKYPKYREGLEKELAEFMKNKKKMVNANSKQREDEMKDAQEFDEQPPPDVFAPHPDFVIAPLGYRLSAAEFREIRWQLRRELSSKQEDDGHRFIRALRRGIGIYIRGLPSAYLQIVQALAQNGRLAVVFSDDSLAYGVNMPFRTCCFCEDSGADILSPLMAQQMAGRAGRRGLDRQGNLLYVGMSWKRIQELMRGILPDVTGKPSLYPTIALQQAVSSKITPEIMKRMCSHSLHSYVTGKKVDGDYLERSKQWMMRFKLLKPDGTAEALPELVKMVWQLRFNPAESLALYQILDYLWQKFRKIDDNDIGAQLALFNMLLRLIDRHPCTSDDQKLLVLAGAEDNWNHVTMLLDEFHNLTIDMPAEAQLPVPLTKDLDGYVWQTIVDNRVPLDLNTADLHAIKMRIWYVGNTLRVLHNEILKAGKYLELEVIFRKCFRRTKWILMDSQI